MTRKMLLPLSGLVLAALLAAPAAPALAGNPGDAGVLSLRLGVGAREAGMGETGVASSTGAAAIWWNPANNVFADFDTELVLQTQRYVGLFDQHAAAVAHRAGGGVLGFIFTGFYSDEIERYSDEPVGVPEGTFEPYDVAFGVSYARALGESFGVGATAKLVYERIDIYSDTGFAFDLGITHRAVIEGLVFAATVTNLGGQMNLRDQPFDLPTAFRIGTAWTPTPALGGKLTLAGEVLMPNDSTEKAHLGGEYRLLPELALRVGTRVNYESQGLTAGAGFRTGRLGVDYAFSDWTTEGFDDGHKFSLRLTW
ncbi:MAG: PorV/PorQ family protein [Krumholzibacteria bacterium]|nr:PorV/PorQ family protein [Candidatus Krumholzibacteria bacterium]